MGNTAKKETLQRPEVTREHALAAGKGDSLPLTRIRMDAVETCQSVVMPTRAKHLWKYSKVPDFYPADFNGLDSATPVLSARVGNPGEMHLWCGQELSVVLDKASHDAGVEVQPLKTHMNVPVGCAVPADHGPLEAMNMALWTNGVYVRIPAGKVLANPLQLTVHTNAQSPFTRVFIDVEDGAHATIVEKVVGSDNPGKSVVVEELRVGRNAVVHHSYVYAQDLGDTLHLTHRAVVAADAQYNYVTVGAGTGRLKADVGSILEGRGANSNIRSFALLDGDGVSDLHTVHHHVADHTTSDLKFRSVLLDRSRSTNTGLILIEEPAVQSEAFQEARNLLLSGDAKVETIPELEIHTNDVVCSHGAATGTVDPNEMFYLNSRGLSAQQATRLIVEGALTRTLDFLPSGVREQVATDVAPAMGRIFS